MDLIAYNQLLAIEFNLFDAQKLIFASLVIFFVRTREPDFSEDAISARPRTRRLFTMDVRIAGQVTLVDNVAETRQQDFQQNKSVRLV